MDNKFKVSLYIRVSTGRQAKEGDSLEEQESELKKFCEYKKYPIHKIHIERGRSAKNTNRPEYQKLLADIKDQKINAVVVKKLDRLSRSLLDFEEFMRIAQKHDVEFISIKENFDTTNAMGKAMLRVALVFAQLEREQTAERIKDVFAFRTEQGLRNGATVPYGYDSINKELIPHKKERKVIEFIFDKFIETKSTTIVTQELNTIGFSKRTGALWDKQRVDYMLRNIIYTGKIRWNGILHQGVHQPLITESKFQQVQEIINENPFISPRNKVTGLLKGLLFCGYCANKLSPNYAKKKNGNIYYYYRCSTTFNPERESLKCKGQYISFTEMHANILVKLLEYANEEFLNALQVKISKHNAYIEKDITLLKAALDELAQSLKNIKKKKEQYLDSLISGIFSKEERIRINDKIDEFSLDEKHIQADVYKQDYALKEKQETLKSIEPFKQNIIKLKVNHAEMSEQIMRDWLIANVSKIIVTKETLDIEFKSLDI
jgi:site-specific DNA recombinase